MESEDRARFAWQPLTPAGVASFAGTSRKRLWLVQFLIGVVATVAVIWFLNANWFPVIRAAIRHLPPGGVLQSSRLVWEGEAPGKLAENPFLAVSVDLRHEGLTRSPAQIQVEFGEKDVVFIAILGTLQVRYPRGYVITCSREVLDPWWGAWAPMILAVVALLQIVALILTWAVLSALYTPVAWLVALFANRDLRLRDSYKLCGAALMPGALFMTFMVMLYGLGVLDTLKLLIGTAAHFVIGWVYVVASPFFLPRAQDPSVARQNPFTDSSGQPPPPPKS